MQNMLLLLSFTVDCEWFKLGKEQWHNGKLKINSLISFFFASTSHLCIYTQKKKMYVLLERDIL